MGPLGRRSGTRCARAHHRPECQQHEPAHRRNGVTSDGSMGDPDPAGRPGRPVLGAGRRGEHRPRGDDDPRHVVRSVGCAAVGLAVGRSRRRAHRWCARWPVACDRDRVIRRRPDRVGRRDQHSRTGAHPLPVRACVRRDAGWFGVAVAARRERRQVQRARRVRSAGLDPRLGRVLVVRHGGPPARFRGRPVVVHADRAAPRTDLGDRARQDAIRAPGANLR